ncbi:MAG: pitrilysin family protein [Bacteroidota bacterium]|nr:pitrilysin family protein [Bacteroidota bacterium]MDP4232725.1 pitrilysin family protein [Bacteroidota bacterium]MDP4243142.1 pitrilysin family protein [Bacteroidota bacterium]MDP4287599.1 pitrilysin family protein [Bacteroidota bacterium]
MQSENLISAAPSRAASIPFSEYDLDNGLHVILARSTGVPLVTTNLWYHIGSKDEDPTRTGFAHLFEHMMFQGSRNVGKTEHFKYIQQAGGLLNATTSVDRTNYFQTLPSSDLALALWLESDRMLALNVTVENFENQRDVVKEEWRQRYKNRPYGSVWETLMRHVFPTSGYNWITIGSMEHLDRSTIDEVRAFHSTYYKPNNCSLALSGSFDEAEARHLIDRYFGGIPKGEDIVRPIQAIEDIAGSIHLTMEDTVRLAAVHIGWRSAPVFHHDEYVLDLLGHVLDTGRSSRLYRELVYRRQIARETEAFNYSLEKSGAFVVSAKVQPNSTPTEVEAAIWTEIQKVKDDLVSDAELEKVKNRVEMSLVTGRSEQGRRADTLQRAYVFKRDTAQVNRELEIYRSISADELRDAARRYLVHERSVALYVLPK